MDTANTIDKYVQDISELITTGSAEHAVLQQVNKVLAMPTPTTQSDARNRISSLDTLRLELVNLNYFLARSITASRKEFDKVYAKEFSKYTLMGRPNQTAVDSEVMSRTPGLLDLKYKIENYTNFKELVSSYIRTLDQTRSTCISGYHDYT